MDGASEMFGVPLERAERDSGSSDSITGIFDEVIMPRRPLPRHPWMLVVSQHFRWSLNRCKKHGRNLATVQGLYMFSEDESLLF